MRSTSIRLAGAAAVLVLGACGTTTQFVNTWKAPDAAPLALRPGDTVVAMVISRNEGIHRPGEDAFATELSRRGLRVIPGYTLLTVDQAMQKDSALETLRRTGAVAAFVVRPLQTTRTATFVPPTYYAPGPYGAWGPYYGYGWGAAVSPGYVVTDTALLSGQWSRGPIIPRWCRAPRRGSVQLTNDKESQCPRGLSAGPVPPPF